MKIIVTDDEAMNLRMVEFMLKKNGHEVITASSGRECLSAVRKAEAQLVLLDILMPVMDGFETCRKIRECPEGKDIPVIFLTAAADSDVLEKVKEFDRADCVSKPVKQDILLAKIADIMG